MNDLVSIGPTQPSRHRRPLAASMSTALEELALVVGAVPGRNSSSTVLRVAPLGLRPVNASTVALTRPLGLVRAKPSTLRSLDTSERIADHSGAEVSSESLPSLGVLSELPIQTPATRAGSVLDDGMAR